MNSKSEKGKENLIQASVEKEHYEKAKKEWKFIGNLDFLDNTELFDLKSHINQCELCSTKIKFRYCIQNKLNHLHLIVGKDCLTKFTNITSKDIEEYHFQVALRKFGELKKKAKHFDLEKSEQFYDFYQSNKSLSPGWMKWSFNLFDKYKIEYLNVKDCFKSNIRKPKYKETMLNMDLRDIQKISPTLTQTAIKELKKKYPHADFDFI